MFALFDFFGLTIFGESSPFSKIELSCLILVAFKAKLKKWIGFVAIEVVKVGHMIGSEVEGCKMRLICN